MQKSSNRSFPKNSSLFCLIPIEQLAAKEEKTE